MAYIISIHIPIAGMSLVPVLLGWPLILLPIHIVFLELIIDPACSLVFEAEPEERDLMKRPPRLAEDRILNRRTITFALVQGFVVLAVVLAVYLYAIFAGLGENGTRTLAFTTIVIANLALILTNRSWSDPIFKTPFSTNKALCWVTGGTLFFLALAVLVPALQGIFLFAPLGFKNMCIGVIAGVGSVLWFEFYKIVRRTSEHHRGNTV
jgi:Ca2+-transporting ATPase